MQGDLGAGTSEVHDLARAVLAFWFDETSDEQRFGKSDALDATIRARFGALREQVIASQARGWRQDPEALLAAIILIDQFSRNLFRGSAEAYAHDELARELTFDALERGWDESLTVEQRQFLYMPLMHAESRALQALSVEKFTKLADPKPLKFAHSHADVIERFGRFPSRNAAVGRESTPEEQEYLSQPGSGW